MIELARSRTGPLDDQPGSPAISWQEGSALAPFTGPRGLSFRIENQLAHAVRLAG
jgi:hypothetical protein